MSSLKNNSLINVTGFDKTLLQRTELSSEIIMAILSHETQAVNFEQLFS